MGWLRELMQVAAPPIDGYGELARRALAHPEWPPDTQPQSRSLAALFSKLDRGIELEWLGDRDAAQRCLALVLGCPIEVVRRAVAPEPLAIGRLRFDDLPYARPFDLREEPLPPGLPPEVLLPSGWARLWWLAPSGSGRSLVGRWLAARGLARFVAGVCWAEIAERLPGAGPLYLELERGDDLANLPAALPPGPVCVAAPEPPADAGAWRVVASPALDDVLPELLEWIEARVPEDGSFEVAAAEAWLRGPLAAGQLPTLGALLGAAGLLDARGVRRARDRSLAELAEAFVNERLERASTKGSAEAQWLKRFGFTALVKLAQAALTTSAEPWAVARSQDEWIALVPAELDRGFDSDRAGSASSRFARAGDLPRRSTSPPAPPPGSYRIVRALVDAGLLAERGPGRLSVTPEFLKHAALARAREALLDEASALGWGEALLVPHAAAGVLDALYLRVAADDFGPIESLLEQDTRSDPALVVATEAALVCLGLRALSGGAEVPAEYLESLWNDQIVGLIELPDDLPRPRLSCSTAPGAGPLAQHAIWMLGMLAASEGLDERQGRAHALLRPWRAPLDEARLTPVLDAIYAALASPDVAERPWAVEAFALGGRLLDERLLDERLPDERLPDERLLDGSETEDESEDLRVRACAPHPLGVPARLARALLDGDLDGSWLRGFGAHPLEVRALQAECAARHIAWSRMAHALWKNWQMRGCPADGDRLFAPDAAHAAAFWPHLPPEVMGTAWMRWVAAPRWPFQFFGPDQWSAFVDYFADRWQRAPNSGVWSAAFELMDLASVQRAVERGRLLEDAAVPPLRAAVRPLLARVWQRFADWLLERLRECTECGEAFGVARLLECAPPARDDAIVRVLGEALSQRATRRAVIDVARSWLCAKIAARRSGWRSAYALLIELENRLARAERARGTPARELDE